MNQHRFDKAHLERVLKGIAGAIVAVGSLGITFGAAYFLTTFIYQRAHFNPDPLLKQLINSFTGLFLLAVIGRLMGGLFRKMGLRREMQMFGPLLAAMQQIARGDFTVRVEHPVSDMQREDDPFNKLFKGINDMAQELNQMEVLRQEFISNVSHEIQSPLTSIRGFARALQSEQLSAQDRAHYLGIIETESMRLSKLSDNLLALASLEAKNMRFEPQPYRLDRQIRNLILACEPQWTSKNIDMDVAVDEVTVCADEDLLSQVWINLLHNAIKFTPQGGRVCVELHERGGPGVGQIEFTVADSGMGIAKADQARVFERFYKADTSRNRSLGGSGLGLSIAKKIVEMHHGEIHVESKPGAGAIFKVCLPAK